MRLIITLSSIPSRFSGLGRTLESLLRQRVPAEQIRLYVPRSYRRFPDWNGHLPRVPEGVLIVRCEEDFGPATKILPAIREFADQPVELLLCDDDRIYDRYWTARFLQARTAHPDCVIAGAGRFVPGHRCVTSPAARMRVKDWKYRLARAATLGLRKPGAWIASGYVDVFKGYAGAMLRPDFIPACSFDIPDLLWTVDDSWLSGNLAMNGVRIWLNAQGPEPGESRAAACDALLKFSLQGRGRGDANSACFDWFRDRYGIWATEPQGDPAQS